MCEVKGGLAMAQVIGNIECPFCGNTLVTNSSPRARKLRECPNRLCHGRFFFYQGKYYVALEDLGKVRKHHTFRPTRGAKTTRKH
jgi:hypothetical protein